MFGAIVEIQNGWCQLKKLGLNLFRPIAGGNGHKLAPQKVRTTLPVTIRRLDLGTGQRVFYAEFDAQCRKRAIVKMLGVELHFGSNLGVTVSWREAPSLQCFIPASMKLTTAQRHLPLALR